jgi:branched-chain amino acid transport system permease protein
MRLKLLAAAIIAIALPFVVPSDYWMRLINMALIFGMLTISLNIVLGYAGLISLGHAGLFGIGAYVAALLTHGRSGVLFVPAFLAAGVLTAAVGFCVGLPALRLRGHYLALSTLGFGEIVSSLLLNWRSLTYGQNGVGDIPAPALFGITLDTDAKFYGLLVVVAGLTLLFSRRLALSRHGRLLFAVRDAELAAGCAGVNVPAIKLTAFTLSAGIAGLALRPFDGLHQPGRVRLRRHRSNSLHGRRRRPRQRRRPDDRRCPAHLSPGGAAHRPSLLPAALRCRDDCLGDLPALWSGRHKGQATPPD